MKFLLLALAITSRSVGSFIAIPEWMPTAVDSTHSIGSDDHVVPFRLSSEDQAAVEAIFDAYYERAFCFSDSCVPSNHETFVWARDFGPLPVREISDMSYLWVTNCGLSQEARDGDNRVFQYSWTTNTFHGYDTFLQRFVPDSRRMIESENMVKVKDATIQMIRHHSLDFPYRGLPDGVSSYVYKSNAWGTVENMMIDGEELPNSSSPRVVLAGTSFLPGVDDLPNGGNWTVYPKEWNRQEWVSRMNKVFGETAVPYSALGNTVDPYIGVGGSCPGGFLYNVWCAVVAGSGGSFLFQQRSDDSVGTVVEGGPFSWWYHNGSNGAFGEYFNQGCTACEGSLSSVLLRLFPRADGSEYGGLSTYPEEGIYSAVVSQVPERRFTPDDYVTWDIQETREFVDYFPFGGDPQVDGMTEVSCPTSIPVSSYVTILCCIPYPTGGDVTPISFYRDRETGRPRISGTVSRYRRVLPSGDVIERGLSNVDVVMSESVGWRDEFWGDDFEVGLVALSDFNIVYMVSSPGVLSPCSIIWDAQLRVDEKLTVTTGVHKVMSQAALTSRILALTDTVYEIPQVRGGGVGPSRITQTTSWSLFTFGPTSRVSRVKLDIDTMPLFSTFEAAVVPDFDIKGVYPEFSEGYFYTHMESGGNLYGTDTPDCNVRAAAGFSGTGYDLHFAAKSASTEETLEIIGLYGSELLEALGGAYDGTYSVSVDWDPIGCYLWVENPSQVSIWDKVVDELKYLRFEGVPFSLYAYVHCYMDSTKLSKTTLYRFGQQDNPTGPGTLSSIVGNRGLTKVYLPSYRLTMREKDDEYVFWSPYSSDIASLPEPRPPNFEDTAPYIYKEEFRHFVEGVEGDWRDVAPMIDRVYEGYEEECEKIVREQSGISEDDWGDLYKAFGKPLFNIFQGEEFLAATTSVKRVSTFPHGTEFEVSGGVVYDSNHKEIESDDVIYACQYFVYPQLVDHDENIRTNVWKPAVLSAVRSVPVVETKWDWGAVKANEGLSTRSLRVPSMRGNSRVLPGVALPHDGSSWRAVNRVREHSRGGGKSTINVSRGSPMSPKPASTDDVNPSEKTLLPIAH